MRYADAPHTGRMADMGDKLKMYAGYLERDTAGRVQVQSHGLLRRC